MHFEKFLILVINLDRAPQRLEKIKLQLDRLGLPWERFVASDGRTLDMNDASLFDPRAFARRHGKTAVPGELGCYLSHVRAFERLLVSDAQYAVVLEDDALLHDEFPEVLIALDKHSSEWDMVKLSGTHRGHPLSLGKLTQRHDLAVMLSSYKGSSAYVLNRQAANIYAHGLLPMRIPYDHEFDRGWYWNLKTRAVWPSPCTHDHLGESTIEGLQVDQRKFTWFRRFPALVWRICNESRRALYGLDAWLRRAFHDRKWT